MELEVTPSSAETENRRTFEPEAEVQAISEIGRLLSNLSPEARRRVLQWAVGFADVSLTGARTVVGTERAVNQQEQELPTDLSQLFEWAAPTKEIEYALLTCYFHTSVKGEPSVDGTTINAELAQMGRRSSNITKTLTHLIDKSPSLVILAGRTGRGTNTRKLYRVTSAGVAQVRAMIRANKATEAEH
jgi:hypothetical protein